MSTNPALPYWINVLQALAVPAIALFAAAIAFAQLWTNRQFAKWQASVAMEQLRHNFYDRRFNIYMAFHELLVAFNDKGSDDLTVELSKANAARAHSPFLLTPSLETYLEELHNAAWQVNARGLLLRNENYCASIPHTDYVAEASKLPSDRSALHNRIRELAERFKALIALKDLERTARQG